jgi:antibiotic biosynthesis monooxygenase (ABM) superfamily enzyme
MYIHAFIFRWKPGVNQAQIQRAQAEILKFQGEIPGLLETHAGVNTAPNRKDYEFGGVMRFTDKAALDAYQTNPLHKKLLDWLVPLIDAVELDIEA